MPGLMVLVYGSGSGFRLLVWELGFWFRVWGFGFRLRVLVWGFEFWACCLGLGSWFRDWFRRLVGFAQGSGFQRRIRGR